MQQLELFPLNLIEQAACQAQAMAHEEMLWKINNAYSDYVGHFPSRMYADHVIFIDGDTPTFTIIPEFWPDMASTYMDETHPTMYNRIVEKTGE